MTDERAELEGEGDGTGTREQPAGEALAALRDGERRATEGERAGGLLSSYHTTSAGRTHRLGGRAQRRAARWESVRQAAPVGALGKGLARRRAGGSEVGAAREPKADGVQGSPPDSGQTGWQPGRRWAEEVRWASREAASRRGGGQRRQAVGTGEREGGGGRRAGGQAGRPSGALARGKGRGAAAAAARGRDENNDAGNDTAGLLVAYIYTRMRTHAAVCQPPPFAALLVASDERGPQLGRLLETSLARAPVT